jgi:predicted transposase/invertase (TIGR01784 family)
MDNNNDNGRFISILSDYGFKVTFGNESNTTFLKKALQVLIDSPIPIKHVEFVKNEMTAISSDSRGGIYDIACIDDNNNHFIVEMQLSEYPEFIQRMKFYALYRFNTLVKKGNYTFEKIPKIYCIGILAKNIFTEIRDYHNVAVLRNVKNEIIDEQMTFVTVELAKFTKQLADIQTDLDKLIYTMKKLHTVTEPSEYPMFWDEEWLKKAILELDLITMTPEQKLWYEMTLSANALVIKNEKRKIEETKNEEREKFVIYLIKNDEQKTDEEIADIAEVSVEFVKKVRIKLLHG